jgi:hypothetical protein
VGDDGSVWSCRLIGRKPGIGSAWRKLKLGTHSSGHKLVTLQVDGVGVPRYVHQLVLEAFVGPCPSGKICRHFPDPNPANNNLNNLQWGTWEENNGIDKVLNGTSNQGERCGTSKLTTNDVLDILANVSSNVKGMKAKMARKHNVSPATISDIIAKRTWTHV